MNCLPLDACMELTGTMKASSQEGSIHVIFRLRVLCFVSGMHDVFRNRDLPSLSMTTKNRSNRLHVKGVSWTALISTKNRTFHSLVLEGGPSDQIRKVCLNYMCKFMYKLHILQLFYICWFFGW